MSNVGDPLGYVISEHPSHNGIKTFVKINLQWYNNIYSTASGEVRLISTGVNLPYHPQ
jgi:hypothetical protein